MNGESWKLLSAVVHRGVQSAGGGAGHYYAVLVSGPLHGWLALCCAGRVVGGVGGVGKSHCKVASRFFLSVSGA